MPVVEAMTSGDPSRSMTSNQTGRPATEAASTRSSSPCSSVPVHAIRRSAQEGGDQRGSAAAKRPASSSASANSAGQSGRGKAGASGSAPSRCAASLRSGKATRRHKRPAGSRSITVSPGTPIGGSSRVTTSPTGSSGRGLVRYQKDVKGGRPGSVRRRGVRAGAGGRESPVTPTTRLQS